MNDLIQKINKARIIWICGNGGSAATAEHLTTDLIKKGYPAICLSSNMSVISMIANDYGYKHIFSYQLSTLADKNDLLITVSCSGTSKNIQEVQNIARAFGMEIYEFETFKKRRNYGLLENKHLSFVHKLIKKL